MSNLRDKTISGIFWSFLQKVGGKGIEVVITILLARILTPKDFGLIGMLAIFIALSQALVQAGFSQALIQKQDTDEEDYSSVFYINLVLSVGLYLLLFFTAPLIADFYHQPILTSMTRVLSLVFVINAFSYVQEARLNKKMKFKTLMIIHLPSTVLSGVVAIFMAYRGYGVWSIVAQRVVMRLAYTVQMWIYAKWKPLWTFNREKAKSLFSFGGHLMVVGVIQTIYRNAYRVVIGKFFPVDILGYYQNANTLARTPISTLSSVVSGVTFPVFSSIQHDDRKLKEGYKKTVQQVMFWLCPALVIAGVLATPLFRFVLTDKWLPAVPYFRILCIGFVFSPLNVYNINILNVKGRSDLFLKVDLFKKMLETIGIIVCIFYSVWALIWFESLFTIVKYVINSYYAGRFINYSLGEQLKDIYLIFVISISMGVLVYFVDQFLTPFGDVVRIAGAGVAGMVFYWLVVKWSRIAPYLEFFHILESKRKDLF